MDQQPAPVVQPNAPTPAPVEHPGKTYSILGIVFACCSLIVLPIIFGPVGIVFGVIGVIKGDRKRGIVAIVLSVVLATASTLIAMYFLSRPAQPSTPASTVNSGATTSTPAFTFDDKTYSVADQLASPNGADYASESYEWVADGETVDNWTTLITTHKLAPTDPAKPLSAMAYAQNVATMLQSQGATLLETSVINTPDAKAAGIDTTNPPYLLAFVFLPTDSSQPAEFDIERIQDAPQGGLTIFIYAQELSIVTNADAKAYLASAAYASERQNVLLAQFPY